MIIYKDATGVYVATQAEAKRMGKGWEQVEVPTTDGRLALCDWLNKLSADKEDPLGNGEEYGIEPDPLEIDGPYYDVQPSPIAQSIQIDEAWDVLPLARKLHFAALAMEDARSALK